MLAKALAAVIEYVVVGWATRSPVAKQDKADPKEKGSQALVRTSL